MLSTSMDGLVWLYSVIFRVLFSATCGQLIPLGKIEMLSSFCSKTAQIHIVKSRGMERN